MKKKAKTIKSEKEMALKEEYALIKQKEREKFAMFRTTVAEQFRFLESEYGFTAGDFEKYPSNHPVDTGISIIYTGKRIAVKIEWLLYDNGFGIGIFELENGVISAGRTRKDPVNLDCFVEYVSQGQVKPALDNYFRDTGSGKIIRSAQKVYELLEIRFEEVAKEYAARLKRYGDAILKGDISILPEVRQYQSGK